jgi:hypothetical protein
LRQLTTGELSKGFVAAWSIAVLVAGCDSGEAPLAIGPRPRLVDYQPRAGVGIDCDPADAGCGHPVNRPLSFRLDRWLLPNTATRQSLRLSAVASDIYVQLQPHYDLVTRTVDFYPQWNWDVDYIYDLRLYGVTPGDTDWGFRSYDGLLLDPIGIPSHILFRVGSDDGQSSVAPKYPTCRDALRAFADAGCTASNCHSAPGACTKDACQDLPRAGLALDSASGLADAIGRVAHATDRNGMSGVATINSERFGLNLPVIEAGEPAMGLLAYRMLLGRNAYRDRSGEFGVPPPSAEELERARSWFGVMDEMPPTDVGWPAGTSPIELTRLILQWIEHGAATSDCQ